jgi:hypothetical protein
MASATRLNDSAGLDQEVATTCRAKALDDFRSSVRLGIEALMSQCGYSRERAVQSLLQELLLPASQNNQDDSEVHHPSNNEVGSLLSVYMTVTSKLIDRRSPYLFLHYLFYFIQCLDF